MNADDRLKRMQAVWADPHLKNNWLYETGHDLSQTGSSDPNPFRALARLLSHTEAIDLYYILHNYSQRPESEWRPDFLRYFKRTIAPEDMPEQMPDDFWLPGFDPETGLPLQ